MKLKELLQGVNYTKSNVDAAKLEIDNISLHSEECQDNGIFFAIKGERCDGNNYVFDAIVHGAAVVISDLPQAESLPHIVVDDVRKCMATIASNFYDNPKNGMRFITVVGTNGKTTTANMIGRVLEYCGQKVAVIGTLGARIAGKSLKCDLTTPDPLELHKLLAEARKEGVTTVVMEVSAHAIYYKKVYGINADIAVFTNFSQDHLDFFKTMERYADTKLSYFNPTDIKQAIVNVDDALGKRIYDTCAVPCFTYGLDNPSDTFAVDAEYLANGTRCIINSNDVLIDFKSKFMGKFNLYNSLAAVSACLAAGVNAEQISRAFLTMEAVNGRFNLFEASKRVVVDFAHTPDGLLNLLKVARELCNGRLILVFGCGGNRDEKKRAIMGRIAAEYADFTIITSDNSRDEAAEDIIMQIEQGFKEVSSDYITITDREHAVTYAIVTASSKDLVVVAGKGGEEYIEANGIKTPYSDKKVVEDVFRRYSL